MFDCPRVDVPLTTNHLIDTSTPVSHIPCTPSCVTPNEASLFYVDHRREHEAAKLREEALVMFDLYVCYCKFMTNNNSPAGCSSQQGQIQEIKRMRLTTPKNEQSRLS